ncbi:PHP domain-containing protein, partial [candidate division NPL-UPA2 bacterium]|nr:PHP domain-containing protein [candidate division NPL-UPA2 bacterium]
MPKDYKDYKGVIHVHSRYSDGSGNLKKIVGAANRAGLDYLIITDHNTLRHKEEGAEGWHKGILVLVGQEISPRTSHYLALGIEKPINPKGRDVQGYIDEVKEQGGLGFIAHPDSQGKRSLPLKKRPWTAWEAKNFTGIELWSYMYD